ncbi:hypothetical protein CPB86DRAFT_849626 [Serendipita vermifera]|nr:hypothetical protein CPB86DRAFT_849626 [Serendipita vermifera]
MSTSNSQQLNLESLFKRALQASSKVVNMPSMEDETQTLLSSALVDYQTVTSRIADLGLFSPNESFQEISARNAIYLFSFYCLGDLQLQARTPEPEDRMTSIQKAICALKRFMELLDDYGVISPEHRKLYSTPLPMDPYKKRETKIAQHRSKTELQSLVNNLKSHRKVKGSTESTTDFDMILDLLTSTSSDDEDEEETKNLVEAVLRLFWVKCMGHLEDIERESEILRSAPPRGQSSRDPAVPTNQSDQTWRLDKPLNTGPLLDKSGRPLRPFTILPSNAGERARLKAEVFRPDHRLPTMTIDELLEEERKQGKFISGGGEASFGAPTSKELLKEASEMDGTVEGEEKSEQRRREEEEWALFTEANPKGMGNTMNRG